MGNFLKTDTIQILGQTFVNDPQYAVCGQTDIRAYKLQLPYSQLTFNVRFVATEEKHTTYYATCWFSFRVTEPTVDNSRNSIYSGDIFYVNIGLLDNNLESYFKTILQKIEDQIISVKAEREKELDILNKRIEKLNALLTVTQTIIENN